MKPPKSRGSGLSFEAVYRRIADRAAKRAEEAKAVKALLDDAPANPIHMKQQLGGHNKRRRLGLTVKRSQAR